MAQEYLPAPSNVRLADLMKEHNISQPELAKEIGCSKSTISRFISGAKGMSFTPAGFLLHLRIFLFPLKIEEEADIQHDAHSGRSGRGQTDHGQAGVGLDAHDVSHRQRRTRRVPAP